jgi:hypothetical protein
MVFETLSNGNENENLYTLYKKKYLKIAKESLLEGISIIFNLFRLFMYSALILHKFIKH